MKVIIKLIDMDFCGDVSYHRESENRLVTGERIMATVFDLDKFRDVSKYLHAINGWLNNIKLRIRGKREDTMVVTEFVGDGEYIEIDGEYYVWKDNTIRYEDVMKLLGIRIFYDGAYMVTVYFDGGNKVLVKKGDYSSCVLRSTVRIEVKNMKGQGVG